MDKPFTLQLNVNGEEHRWPMERKCLRCKGTGSDQNYYICGNCMGIGMELTSMGLELMSFVWRHTHKH